MTIICQLSVLDVPRLLQSYLCPFCVIIHTFLQKSTMFDNFGAFLKVHKLTFSVLLRILTSML